MEHIFSLAVKNPLKDCGTGSADITILYYNLNHHIEQNMATHMAE